MLVAVKHTRLDGGLRLVVVVLHLLVHVLHLLLVAVWRQVLSTDAFRVCRCLIDIVTHWLGISNLIF